MGEAALPSHAGGAGHKAAVRKLVEAGNWVMVEATGQMNGSLNRAEDSKERVAIHLQRDASNRIAGSDWPDLHHSPCTNSTSHSEEVQDGTFPAAYITAPGTSRLISQHLHPSGSEAEGRGRPSVQHNAVELSRMEHQQRAEALEQQQQMKILEWEKRMKVLAWEQELVKDKRRAAQQKAKAFRMKKAYYKAKLKRLGEDMPPSSSSSSDEEEKTSGPMG
uniref:uncharacterized protein fsbp n=1 Tax=Monopterus albus TaxID=43700 RepID=UPI0009B461BC|nr:uncharacterized protein LOC109973792 [Monopterus albus]